MGKRVWITALRSLTSPVIMVRWAEMRDGGMECEVSRRVVSLLALRTTVVVSWDFW